MEESNETETEAPMDEIKVPIQVEDVKLVEQALISSSKPPVIEWDTLRLTLDDGKEYTIAEAQEVVDKSKEGF